MYNVSEYIEECIESIVKQPFNEIAYEIICVDDCSTDDSLSVLKKLGQKYQHIHIIKNSQNKGVSYSRNKAIDNATGKYIWFVDPDDMLFPNIVSTMYVLAEKNETDFIIGNYRRFCDEEELNKALKENNKEKFICTESEEPSKDETDRVMQAVWAGLLNREFLVKNNIRFNENMIAQEDTLFYWDISLCKYKRYKCNLVCYLYRQRQNSVMNVRNNDRAIKYYESMLEMLRVYKSQLSTVPDYKREILLDKISHSHQNVATTLAAVTDTKYVKEQMKMLKKEKIYPYKFRKVWLQSQGISFYTLLVYLVPIKPMFWLLHLLYKIRRG